MKNKKPFFLSFFAIFLVPLFIYAQTPEDIQVKGDDKTKKAALDLSVPTSPAFSALGLTPQSVIRPTSPREFAASLINGVDPNGNLQNGIAVELAPFLMWHGNDITLNQYQNPNNLPDDQNPRDKFSFDRMLYRTSLSLATTKGTSDDDKSSRIAFGLTLTPYDLGDPRNDGILLDCFLRKNKEFDKFEIEKKKLGKGGYKKVIDQPQEDIENIVLLKNVDIPKKEKELKKAAKEVVKRKLEIQNLETKIQQAGDQNDQNKVKILKEKQKDLQAELKVGENKIEILKLKKQGLQVKLKDEEKKFDGNFKKAQQIVQELNQFCKAEARKRNWNATSWNIGVAPTFLSGTGRTKDLQWSGAAVWTSFAYGFDTGPFETDLLKDNSQVILHARYRGDERFPNPLVDGAVFTQDTFLVAAQGRIFGPDIGSDNEPSRVGGPDLNFQFEVSYRMEDRKGRNDEEIFRYSAAAEYKVVDDVYLKFTLGSEAGGPAGQDQSFAIGDLKWGFSTE